LSVRNFLPLLDAHMDEKSCILFCPPQASAKGAFLRTDFKFIKLKK